MDRVTSVPELSQIFVQIRLFFLVLYVILHISSDIYTFTLKLLNNNTYISYNLINTIKLIH